MTNYKKISFMFLLTALAIVLFCLINVLTGSAFGAFVATTILTLPVYIVTWSFWDAIGIWAAKKRMNDIKLSKKDFKTLRKSGAIK